MTGVIIVFFNNADFLIKQKEHLDRFMQDEFRLIAIDNSSESNNAAYIKHHAERLGVEYVRTSAGSKNGSDSHAFALCLAYHKYVRQFEQILLLDHDAFLVKPFSVTEALSRTPLAGLGQVRDGETYFWPGYCLFKTSIPMDFSISPGKDTGGNTSKAIQSIGEDNCTFYDEVYVQNPGFNKSMYNFYSLLNNGTVLHFINGSNWNNAANNEERINSLLNILKSKIA